MYLAHPSHDVMQCVQSTPLVGDPEVCWSTHPAEAEKSASLIIGTTTDYDLSMK